MKRLDWWLRFRAQKILDWTGRRFGATVLGAIANVTTFYLVAYGFYMWIDWQLMPWTNAMRALTYVIYVGFGIYAYHCHERRPDTAADVFWMSSRLWRFFNMGFAIVFVPIDFLVGFTLGDFFGWLSFAAGAAIPYVASLNEPPPREEKKPKLTLAHSRIS